MYKKILIGSLLGTISLCLHALRESPGQSVVAYKPFEQGVYQWVQDCNDERRNSIACDLSSRAIALYNLSEALYPWQNATWRDVALLMPLLIGARWIGNDRLETEERYVLIDTILERLGFTCVYPPSAFPPYYDAHYQVYYGDVDAEVTELYLCMQHELRTRISSSDY